MKIKSFVLFMFGIFAACDAYAAAISCIDCCSTITITGGKRRTEAYVACGTKDSNGMMCPCSSGTASDYPQYTCTCDTGYHAVNQGTSTCACEANPTCTNTGCAPGTPVSALCSTNSACTCECNCPSTGSDTSGSFSYVS
ncbi:MAG: hypothetical protein LBJ18_01010 [Rickettsiales bacterium]|nr:hypothetical protein [Rickettsiales bacterium]